MMKAHADANTSKVDWCKTYINKLREISFRKLDEATAYVAKVITILTPIWISYH